MNTHNGSSLGSQPSKDNLQYTQLAKSLLSSVGQKYHPASTIYRRCKPKEYKYREVTRYLVRLAYPALFPIMRPCRTKCCQSRLCDPVARRVFNGGGVGAALLEVHHDGPSAVRCMLEMLCNGVVVLFPAIQRPVALETCCVIGICLVWFVVESGVCQLESHQVNYLARWARVISPRNHIPQLVKVAGAAM